MRRSDDNMFFLTLLTPRFQAMLALMGASGAGKTTLLDVLGARKDDGKIEGDITVDGRPPGPSFQRTCGYVGQMDVHE